MKKSQRGQSEQVIRTRLLQAIFEQRMPPGARLTEEALAATFDVSRTTIRQVIARLAQDGILVKLSTGATHVAAPSRREAQQLLVVRRMIEPEIVKILAENAATLSFTELSAHLALEDRARRAGDRGTLVRLTGEFHLQLAQLTGNKVLIRLMTELQALVCLAILLYASGDDACPPDEHRKIVTAIKKKDGSSAAAMMLHHLDHIERDLRLDDKPTVEISEALTWLGQRQRTSAGS
ncbi:GntR family transcriptional regulator [Bradyrhizobium prioriisuperbiae]|uniref:GntR family transcriptional regulator n=1 Tax=Bradyrhizobium prioriisuperbiae TaxID=2854389 RepID=UPI0028EEA776|nr:GntR family transcriptional regulator [Bradyrhizobium prioritasuperba]